MSMSKIEDWAFEDEDTDSVPTICQCSELLYHSILLYTARRRAYPCIRSLTSARNRAHTLLQTIYSMSHSSEELLFSMLDSSGVLNHWATNYVRPTFIKFDQYRPTLIFSWTGSHYLISSTSIACVTYNWTRFTCSIQMCRPQSCHFFVGST
jgi:hypothetical protein